MSKFMALCGYLLAFVGALVNVATAAQTGYGPIGILLVAVCLFLAAIHYRLEENADGAKERRGG